MTGFTRREGAFKDMTWGFEAKSVNGKGLDIRLRLPTGFDALEVPLKKLAAKHFRRGNFQINLQVTSDQSASALQVNEQALDALLKIVEPLQKRLDAAPVNVETLLGLRGVLEMAEPDEDAEIRAEREAHLIQEAENAFVDLAVMRASEGGRIEKVIRQQIDTIENLTIAARDCPGRQPDAIKARLAEQVSRLLEASEKLDRDRLHAEAVLIATRADIQEEIDRLFAHVEAARELISATEPAGRKLDFLAQEFNREANTLCSKASVSELSRIGLELKTTIDQLREQVQNIE